MRVPLPPWVPEQRNHEHPLNNKKKSESVAIPLRAHTATHRPLLPILTRMNVAFIASLFHCIVAHSHSHTHSLKSGEWRTVAHSAEWEQQRDALSSSRVRFVERGFLRGAWCSAVLLNSHTLTHTRRHTHVSKQTNKTASLLKWEKKTKMRKIKKKQPKRNHSYIFSYIHIVK